MSCTYDNVTLVAESPDLSIGLTYDIGSLSLTEAYLIIELSLLVIEVGDSGPCDAESSTNLHILYICFVPRLYSRFFIGSPDA